MDATKKMERIMKGAANHWRIKILFLLERQSGLTLFEISELLSANFKTTSEHTHRLTLANLVTKTYRSNRVHHRLTELGKTMLNFLKSLE